MTEKDVTGLMFIGSIGLSIVLYYIFPQNDLPSTIFFWVGVIGTFSIYRKKIIKTTKRTQNSQQNKSDTHAKTETSNPNKNEDLKSLYRNMMKKYHPDFATNETDKKFRTELTAKINRAYQDGDIATLRLFQ